MLHSAGKITLTTVFTAVCVFAFIFLLDVGKDRFSTVLAQATTSSSGTATTSLTVLNLPPQWVTMAYEFEESSTNTPTNSGDVVEWRAVASNDKDYWLIICEDSATATPTRSPTQGDHGNPNNAPTCPTGTVQWAVSDPTPSGEVAIAATTTLESAPFDESNDWYAWICDDDFINERCNNISSQGISATNSSPFVVNSRPVLDAVDNDGPTLPGDIITFFSTSSDPDTLRGGDEIVLHVCDTNNFDVGNVECADTTYATTTGTVFENATAEFEIRVPQMSGFYDAHVFLVDEFGHIAINDFASEFEVANATPVVNESSISLTAADGSSLLVLTDPGAETTGFQLEFEVADDNSCVAFDQQGDIGDPGSEFEDVIISVFRDGIGSTTCDGTAGPYDPNNCYTSGVGTSTWNYTCTASTTTCGGGGLDPEDDRTMLYECEFPLWYVADPTQGTTTADTPFFDQEWAAAASVIDKDFATSTHTQGIFTVDLAASLFFNLATAEIPYGQLEPGDSDDFLHATTTILALGNVGVNQDLLGTSMCSQYAPGNCTVSATSTIPAEEQEFGTSTVAYGSGFQLSDVTEQFLALNIAKPTSTSTPSDGDVLWGIGVPSTITLAGDYTGINTFTALMSDGNNW